MKNKKILTMGMILMSLALISTISAFGVSHAFYRGYPHQLSPGQTADDYILLQNLNGKEDVYVLAEITTGSEIVKLVDTIDNKYIIPAGGKTRVPLETSIPSDAEIGTIYQAKITFTTISTSETGEFSLGQSIGQNWDINVISPEQEAPLEAPPEEAGISNWIIYVVVAIVIILIIIFFIRKKEKKPDNLQEKPQ